MSPEAVSGLVLMQQSPTVEYQECSPTKGFRRLDMAHSDYYGPLAVGRSAGSYSDSGR